jgi:hypothetical protein
MRPFRMTLLKERVECSCVDATGCDGPIEVETFNEEIWESADTGLLQQIQHSFLEHVGSSNLPRSMQQFQKVRVVLRIRQICCVA